MWYRYMGIGGKEISLRAQAGLAWGKVEFPLGIKKMNENFLGAIRREDGDSNGRMIGGK